MLELACSMAHAKLMPVVALLFSHLLGGQRSFVSDPADLGSLWGCRGAPGSTPHGLPDEPAATGRLALGEARAGRTRDAHLAGARSVPEQRSE